MIPPDQLMETRVDSSFMVTTRIFNLDSVASNITTYTADLGSHINPATGRIDLGLFMNYEPYGFDTDEADVSFGKNAVADSMTLGMNFSALTGDTLVPLEVKVYEIQGVNFSSDSTYYSNFDMSSYLSPEPILVFEVNKPGVIVKKLPEWFYEKHVIEAPLDFNNPYYDVDLFHKTFNGLYFEATPQTTGKGIIMTMDMSQSRMTLFYHNDEMKPDTSYQHAMYFYSDAVYYNTFFNTAKFDYSYADPLNGGVRPEIVNNETAISEYSYTAGFGGLGTTVTIPIDKVHELQDKAKSEGYSRIGIHRAELVFEIVEPTKLYYEMSFSRIALYFNFDRMNFLPEYNPLLESLASSSYVSTIDGRVNRSRGIYTLDITSYMQRLFAGSFSRTDLQLLPSYAENKAVGYTWAYGSTSSKPPKMAITYTMIK